MADANEEEDGRGYDDFARDLQNEQLDGARMFGDMAEEETEYCQRLIDLLSSALTRTLRWRSGRSRANTITQHRQACPSARIGPRLRHMTLVVRTGSVR
ncbi:hypothetical protein ABID82_003339 [Methylobacterium sp. PvP062]|uniref:Uncharacterized protein n=2 Tax=Methylobacterium TaxID=407 RepID=A0ABV2NCC7_9HYPH|nr:MULTISPECIES: hypothetical protein [Methylobacterium]MCX7333554.1 hypothetical protein [Hyphomicrobiales bacterium]MBP2492625.1 hypothetical protein [Methylobacterium sp. PvP105]MBP2501003.1 hypothetical protein [Methylobacterium sp. PvP109]MDQ0440532.1 hypothetical protein [Methylobacterium persicinum]GJE36436.1 hypothetical protein KHHGKMAE_0487 [Methylobacterium persicinum]